MFSNKAKTTDNDAVVYVVTYPAEKGLGHTALFVQRANGQSFHTSIFPSSRRLFDYRLAPRVCDLHNISAGIVPVASFNNSDPVKDASMEKQSPSSILMISNLNFVEMKKEHDALVSGAQSNREFFSLHHNSSINLFHGLLRVAHAHRDLKPLTTGGFDPIITSFPTSDDLLKHTPKKRNRPLNFSNCAEAVERVMKAGGHEVKHHENSKVNYFLSNFSNKTPSTTREAVANSGGKEMINEPDKLPTVLQKSIKLGQTFHKPEPVAKPLSASEAQDEAIRRAEFN
jgi:hypothetical protein